MTLTGALRELRRVVAWHRGLVAGGLAAVAVGCSLVSLAPPRTATVRVLTAARELPAGSVLRSADIAAAALPAAVVPVGTLRPGALVVGRLLTGPVRRGKPLTDVRFVGPGLLAALGPGRVAAPVRIADPGAVELLHLGDHVDVLAASPDSPPLSGSPAAAPPTPARATPDLPSEPTEPGERTEPGEPSEPAVTGTSPLAPANVVAANTLVLAVPTGGSETAGEEALVVLAATPEVAGRLAAAAVSSRLSVAIRAP